MPIKIVKLSEYDILHETLCTKKKGAINLKAAGMNFVV